MEAIDPRGDGLAANGLGAGSQGPPQSASPLQLQALQPEAPEPGAPEPGAVQPQGPGDQGPRDQSAQVRGLPVQDPHEQGPGDSLRIAPARPADDAARDELVTAHPRGSVFHLAGWGRAVERVFGHRRQDLLAWRGAQLVGVLPLARCAPFPGQAHLISMPYAVEGGPLGVDPAVEQALVDAALALARAERVGRLELRCTEDLGFAGLSASDLYVDFRQDLPRDPGEVLARFRKEERRLVRRAREQLEVSEGPWYVGELARSFQQSKQRLGSHGLPLAWFRALQDELPGRTAVHVARQGAELLASSMSFVHGDTFHMYYIGTEPEANRQHSVTSFLIAHLMERAVEQGLAVYDLGRSRKDSGAASFKRNQGFEPRPLHYRYGLVRSRALPSLNPSNPRTRVLQDAWKRLPQWLAVRLAGPMSRRLP
jgi:FemAB-related protein (PEP-CTERM system-associated)